MHVYLSHNNFIIVTVTTVSSQSFPFVLNATSISGNDTLGEIHVYYRVSAILNGNIGDVCSSNGVTDQVANELCRQEISEEGSGEFINIIFNNI